MRSNHAPVLVLALTLAGGLVTAPPAGAQTRTDIVEYTAPERGFLRTSALTLGLPYAPVLVLGRDRPRRNARGLLAPGAGPWPDFAAGDRDDGRRKRASRFLLVDGLTEGVGALELLGSFFLVEHGVPTQGVHADGLGLRFVPTRVNGGYGLNAIGHF